MHGQTVQVLFDDKRTFHVKRINNSCPISTYTMQVQARMGMSQAIGCYCQIGLNIQTEPGQNNSTLATHAIIDTLPTLIHTHTYQYKVSVLLFVLLSLSWRSEHIRTKGKIKMASVSAAETCTHTYK